MVRAIRAWRGGCGQRGMRRGWRHLNRADAHPGVAVACSISRTIALAFTGTGAHYSRLHARGGRPAVKRLGGERPLRVRGVGAVKLRLDGEQGRVVG